MYSDPTRMGLPWSPAVGEFETVASRWLCPDRVGAVWAGLCLRRDPVRTIRTVASIGRSESVISREITRHGGRQAYRAWKADAAARESRSRPKERKIDTGPELRGRVAGDLKKGWSPFRKSRFLRPELLRSLETAHYRN